MKAWRWALSQVMRRLWMRASLYGVFGLAAALLAAAFSPLVPDALAKPFGGGVVTSLLDVLATSLLAVATFSTAAMLTAYTNVSQGATPRAAALITGDNRAQGALSSFIGAFIYSVVAFSAIGTGYYANGGRAILFAVTLVMLAWVAITLLRWLDQLLDLAQVGHAVDQVERSARAAICGRFGARLDPACWSEPPKDALPVEAAKVGYVRNIDLDALDALASREGLQIWVATAPGAFVHARRALVHLSADRALGSDIPTKIRAAFDIGHARSFDQDPRFGFVVLGEVASRALSPGINDPGTAVVVVAAATRLLTDWREACEARPAQTAPPAVRLRPIAYTDLLDDVFRPVATDGASSLTVALRLQKALRGLHLDAEAHPEMTAALDQAARMAAERTLAALTFEPDKVVFSDQAALIGV